MDQLPDTARAGGPAAQHRIKRQMAQGIAWMTAARMGVRFLGLLSTLVLARLLTPADFGLIALAMSVVKLVETLSEFGFEMPLIQKRDATRDDFDTAWTLNVMLAGIVCTLIAVAASFAAGFFSEPRIEAILYFIAAGHFLLSFQNIGTVQFRRQLNFKRDFALQVAQKVSMVAVAIPCAFALRSYWALVAGIVAGNVAAVIVSYAFLPYRPRLCLKSWRPLLGFSKWIQLSSMLRYLRDRGPMLVMGRLLDASAIGLFSVAKEIGGVANQTLIAPINRAVFPGYSRLSHDAERLRDAYKSTLGLIALVAVPGSAGLAAVSNLLVPVALGPQWHAAAPLLTLLALGGATRALTASTASVLYATGQPRLQTLTVAIQSITLLPMIAVGVFNWGMAGAAWAYLLHSVIVIFPVCYVIVFRNTPIQISDAWDPLWRPALSAAVMFAVTKTLTVAWATTGTWTALPRLVAVVLVGALVFTGCIAALWQLSGRPEGAEKALLRRLGPRLERLRSRLSS
jgi:O-antigen/teichoic acid export membrane protein